MYVVDIHIIVQKVEFVPETTSAKVAQYNKEKKKIKYRQYKFTLSIAQKLLH